MLFLYSFTEYVVTCQSYPTIFPPRPEEMFHLLYTKVLYLEQELN